MKRYLSLILAFVLLLPGCASQPPEEAPGQSAQHIAEQMLAATAEREEADSLAWFTAREEVDGYLTGYYRLEETAWKDGAIVRMEGARAFELAVLQADGSGLDSVTAALQEYLLDRRAAFTGYLPGQAELVDQALILTKGQWAALIVCQDPEAARNAFEDCFGGQAGASGIPQPAPPAPDGSQEEPSSSAPGPEHPAAEANDPPKEPDASVEEPSGPAAGRTPFADPQKDDMSLYDTSAILAAWESGDNSALSEKDRAVLEAARAVFAQRVTPGMSAYETEAALYTWLIEHVSYDQSHYEKTGAPRTSYEPYGPLIDGTGVCLGYASAFQLFMDMAGIECITVTGAAYQNRENHAWNMVKLNGAWYCVDATWDQGFLYQAAGQLRFFNVTSSYMALTNHQWDYDSVPEATAEDFGRS